MKKKIVRAYLDCVEGHLQAVPESGQVIEGMIEIQMIGVTEERKLVRFSALYSEQTRSHVVPLLRQLEALIEGTEQVVTEEI